MVVPAGFHVEVFAAEPMIRQPVTACFDERGRLWVIEYLQYPNPAGLKPVTVDQYLRTEYDRVPEPPPRGPRGADRIKILEDTDGDGRADKATVFVEGLNLASGLAVGHGGVFVGQAPYLLFYPDRDRDDRPDGDPEVLLTGLRPPGRPRDGQLDAAWGPDGWLYGAQGSTVTARIRGVEFQQGDLAVSPADRRHSSCSPRGAATPGASTSTRRATPSAAATAAYVAFHMVQGGNYWKGFAKHGPLHNPHAFGYFDADRLRRPQARRPRHPRRDHLQGRRLPRRRSAAPSSAATCSRTPSTGTRSTPDGSTFTGRHGGTLIDARDPWFRPIDLQVGPDGCVYVVDWYDRRACAPRPARHLGQDQRPDLPGRLRRRREGRAVRPRRSCSSDELVALRTSPNDWYAAEARRILAERRDPSVDPRPESACSPPTATRPIALRDLWALHVSGGLDDSTALGPARTPASRASGAGRSASWATTTG